MKKFDLVIWQVLYQWDLKVDELTEVMASLGACSAMKEVAPGKNKVIYLLGHLIAIQDHLAIAMQIGEKQFPEYADLFLTPQHTLNQYPDFDVLLDQWRTLNSRLLAAFKKLEPHEWLSRHHFISEQEFELDLRKNKLHVLISSYTHLCYHLGQLTLILSG